MPLLRNPAEAIAWANRQDRWAPHSCLNFVKNAYYGDQSTQNALDGKPFLALARNAWENSTEKHYDRNPPVGALMYFDGVNPSDPGDVQLVTGPGITRRTDVGEWGRVATTDIWWMERVVGRRYLGWTGDILGYSYFGTPATPNKHNTEGGSLMGLNVIAESEGKKRLLGNIDGNVVTFGSKNDLVKFLSNKGVSVVNVTTGVFEKFLKRANK